MDDLIAFLRARLDEDEQGAQQELALLREFPYPDDFQVEYQWVRMARHPHGGVSTSHAPGAPTPTRVLAEVKAKRRILDGFQWEGQEARAIALLAEVYADHPDYRPEWRP